MIFSSPCRFKTGKETDSSTEQDFTDENESLVCETQYALDIDNTANVTSEQSDHDLVYDRDDTGDGTSEPSDQEPASDHSARSSSGTNDMDQQSLAPANDDEEEERPQSNHEGSNTEPEFVIPQPQMAHLPLNMRLDDMDNYDEENDPKGIRRGGLLHLAREWVLLQLGRVCSDKVSNDYFDFAWTYAETFVELKKARNGRPSHFRDLRRKVMEDNVPQFKMDFIYVDLSLTKEERESHRVFESNRNTMPLKKYPPETHELLCQVTRLSVSMEGTILDINQEQLITDIYLLLGKRRSILA